MTDQTDTGAPSNTARRNLLVAAGLGAAAMSLPAVSGKPALAQNSTGWDKTFPKKRCCRAQQSNLHQSLWHHAGR